MSWKNLNGILNQIQQDPSWKKYQQYCQLLHCWYQIVPLSVRDNTRPLYLSRQILWVATSSAARAQTLFMQRQQFLEALNAKWPDPIIDIRFSTAHWHPKSLNPKLSREHPPHMAPAQSPPSSTQPLTQPALSGEPEQVFQNWAQSAQKRSRAWPLCPQCQSPSPTAEIQRWQMCRFCAVKRWKISQ